MTDASKLIELEAKLTETAAKLADALAQIKRLEALVSQLSIKKTSKNSHLSPSSDLSRKNESLREKSDKPVGGQFGHKGHTLKMSTTPDVVKELRPDYCNACGGSLLGEEFELEGRRQVIDIPPILPIITEYQCFGTTCSCGHHQSSSFPDDVINHVQYGKNIQSLVVYQRFYQFIPFGRLQDFFAKICWVPLSKGTIENIIRRSAEKATPVYEKLRQVIAVSFFVGSDETGFKVNGAKHWFWVWQNAVMTYIVAACTRSKQVILDTFPEGLPQSILCSDRLAAQLSTFSKGTQICFAHLLRDLNYLIAAEKTQWATDFKALLKEAIALKQAKDAYDKNDEKALEIELRADNLLKITIIEQQLNDPDKYKQTLTFFRAMGKLRHALFPFLYHEQVPFDNNRSERAIRNVKIKIKVSGQFKSLQKQYAIIRSVIDTAIKNGQSVFHAIEAIINLPPPEKEAG